MADDKTNNNVPSDAPSKDKQQSEQVPEKIADLTGGKFKSVDNLVDAYKELEKKLGEQGEEVKQSREFAAVVQPLLDVIRQDPELFKSIYQKLRATDKPVNSNADTKNDKEDKDEIRNFAVDTAIAQFEAKYGIVKMTPEERKALRTKIGNEVFELTGKTLTEVDLRRLPTVLDKAYVLANKENLVDKSKLEALVSDEGEKEGGIPSISSSPEKKEQTLSPEEARTAEKLGLSREQYLTGKKEPAKSTK